MPRGRVLVIVGLAVVAALMVGKDLLAAAAVSTGVKMVTGLDAKIGSMRVGLLGTRVGIRGLRVLNPRGYADRVMVDVPDIYIDYKLLPFFRGTAHLETVRLYLHELNVIKAADGTLNLHAMKALESKTVRAETQRQQQQPAKALPFRIDVLELKVDRVVYKDYTKSPAQVQAFDVNIDERYQDITNPYSFAALVVARALTKTTVARLAQFDVAGLQASVTNALQASASQLSGQLGQQVGQVGQEAFGEAGQAVEEAAGALKGLFNKKE